MKSNFNAMQYMSDVKQCLVFWNKPPTRYAVVDDCFKTAVSGMGSRILPENLEIKNKDCFQYKSKPGVKKERHSWGFKPEFKPAPIPTPKNSKATLHLFLYGHSTYRTLNKSAPGAEELHIRGISVQGHFVPVDEVARYVNQLVAGWQGWLCVWFITCYAAHTDMDLGTLMEDPSDTPDTEYPDKGVLAAELARQLGKLQRPSTCVVGYSRAVTKKTLEACRTVALELTGMELVTIAASKNNAAQLADDLQVHVFIPGELGND